VQVGAYIDRDQAQKAFDRLTAAGFSPDYERHNEYYRVVIPGVRLEDKDAITRRLYLAGFSDPWIREE
jgi:cell division protein FtsN